MKINWILVLISLGISAFICYGFFQEQGIFLLLYSECLGFLLEEEVRI